MLKFSVFHRIIMHYIDFICYFYIYLSPKDKQMIIHNAKGQLRRSLHLGET